MVPERLTANGIEIKLLHPPQRRDAVRFCQTRRTGLVPRLAAWDASGSSRATPCCHRAVDPGAAAALRTLPALEAAAAEGRSDPTNSGYASRQKRWRTTPPWHVRLRRGRPAAPGCRPEWPSHAGSAPGTWRLSDQWAWTRWSPADVTHSLPRGSLRNSLARIGQPRRCPSKPIIVTTPRMFHA
jgi:hypothetical protein